jgi:hypothetical protein
MEIQNVFLRESSRASAFHGPEPCAGISGAAAKSGDLEAAFSI